MTEEQSASLKEALSYIENVPEVGDVWDENHACDNMKAIILVRQILGKTP